MAQLGTLTAGVAHELNNPAAAVKRGVEQLTEAVTTLLQAQAGVDRLSLDAAQQANLLAVGDKVRGGRGQARILDGPTGARMTSSSSWRPGWTIAGCRMPGSCRRPWWSWATTRRSWRRWLNPLRPSSFRVSSVGWGQPTQPTTCWPRSARAPAVSLRSSRRSSPMRISIKRRCNRSICIRVWTIPCLFCAISCLASGYGASMRPICLPFKAMAASLNQVWTNLIDNAVDALENTTSPEIILRTVLDGDWVTVEVQDNGPGIPSEIQSRIFDAFFTTKPPGKGTGLGLEISYSIVVNKHRGNIKVFSQPGFTSFQVILPLNFDAVDSMTQPVPAVAKGNDDQMLRILRNAKTIAVVGMSTQPERPSHSVPAYLQAHGYRIIPVNPSLDQALGEQAYPDLLSVPEPVDVVDIFRRSEDVQPIVEQAIRVGAKVIWMQEGIVNEEAADLARRAGLEVVMDACMPRDAQAVVRPGRRMSVP